MKQEEEEEQGEEEEEARLSNHTLPTRPWPHNKQQRTSAERWYRRSCQSGENKGENNADSQRCREIVVVVAVKVEDEREKKQFTA